MAHGKKYRDAVNRYDTSQLHTISEAIDLVRSLSSATFDETVERAPDGVAGRPEAVLRASPGSSG